MGLQKYRADVEGEQQKNGGVPAYAKWMGGPSLALVRNCKIEGAELSPRTVYVRGEADTFFSIPAACQHKGKIVRGYLTVDDNQEYVFRAYKDQVQS